MLIVSDWAEVVRCASHLMLGVAWLPCTIASGNGECCGCVYILMLCFWVCLVVRWCGCKYCFFLLVNGMK